MGNLADARIGSSVYNLLSTGASTYTGRPVSPSTAMTYTAVYAIVAAISKLGASCPLVTYRNTGRNLDTKNPARTDYRYRLLKEQPNSEMSAFNWKEQIISSLLLWGNSYSYIERDGAGRIINIWPLEPGYVQVLRTRVGGQLIYRYFPHNPYAVPVVPGIYPWYDILHIPNLGFDGLMGFSPITLNRQAIGLGLGYQEYMGRFLQNGGKPPFWIEFPGEIEDREKFMEVFRATNGALDNAGKPFLGYAGLKLHELKMSPEDAQYIEGNNFGVEEVCRMYDYPVSLMAAGKTKTYASAEQDNIYLATHTIAPLLSRIEHKVNLTVLGSDDALTCRHDMRALYRGDMVTVAKAHAQLIQCGEITPNEGRIDSDRNPGPPELDMHWMQGAMAPVDRLAKDPAPQPQAAPPNESAETEEE
jgi:HK97 family phage portal protein